ncbi:hypothetical protein QYE76_059391 [Lolium multiflorum]|uniref:Uncharacterized protein n=1 Tax=Lolium multiflorum TaxID=4521 RepID=A0AAD8RWX1_LOLMU|nr:hypothetical protein QYE76_059391 [Lolium multiflorum]
MRSVAREVIQNIDKLDGGNQLATVDYVEDLYKFYKVAENKCRPCDYMNFQLYINSKMRGILVDWIIEVHHVFDLVPEALYLAVYIIDRYLSLQIILRKKLQLVGVTALLIACKYEDTPAPRVRSLVHITDNAYTGTQVLRMEKAILDKLEWNLTVPTPYVFLMRFLKVASRFDLKNDKEMENMSFFFADLANLQYELVQLKPSKVAAAAVYAARITLKKTHLWTDTLKHHTGYAESQLL